MGAITSTDPTYFGPRPASFRPAAIPPAPQPPPAKKPKLKPSKRRVKTRMVRLSSRENEAFLEAWDKYREDFGECSIEQFIRERCGAATISDRDEGTPRGRRPRR